MGPPFTDTCNRVQRPRKNLASPETLMRGSTMSQRARIFHQV
jgi:hypothetical protein